MDLFLLLLRIVVGGLLLGHGAQKLFGWFGGHGIDGTAGFMESLGYRPSRAAAIGAGLSEAIGGGLLVVGLFTPIAAAMVVGTMLNAIISAHWSNGIWATDGGYELPLTNAVAALAIVAAGPGLISLDALYGGAQWGGAAAVITMLLGVAVGGIVLSRRVDEATAAETEPQPEDETTRVTERRAA